MNTIYILTLVFSVAGASPGTVELWYSRGLSEYPTVEECWSVGDTYKRKHASERLIGYLCVAKRKDAWERE